MVAVANSVVLWKKSTLTIAPSLSDAVADIAMRAGAINVALFTGLVRVSTTFVPYLRVARMAGLAGREP